MGNRYYRPGPGRAAGVRGLFDRIAGRYDLVNDLQSLGLHRRWKNRLVHRLEPAPGDRVLDVCCGTGDVARALARSGARVVGLDFSHPMLRRAADRSAAGGSWVLGDAMRLPFPKGAFDRITISYGLRNLADVETGLRELGRVLRPGGRLGILDFGVPPQPLWRALYFSYLRLAVPCMGWLFCGDAAAYGYILESLKVYAAQEGVRRSLESLGFTNVTVTNLLGGVMSIHTADLPQ